MERSRFENLLKNAGSLLNVFYGWEIFSVAHKRVFNSIL